jgi:hypothetical protein
MKTLALLLALTVGMAQAQDTTLTYHGLDMTGTSTTYSRVGPFSHGFEANFFVQLDISGSLATHDLQLLSAVVIGNQYILDLPSSLVGQGGPDFCSLGGCIDLTTKNGRITGATIAISFSGGVFNNAANIGPAGDSFSDSFYDSYDMCLNRASGECILTAANKTPGTWTVATISCEWSRATVRVSCRGEVEPKERAHLDLAFARRETKKRLNLEGRQFTRELLQPQKRGLPGVHRILLNSGCDSISQITNSK